MNQHDWVSYIGHMAQILQLDLDAPRRAELLLQLTRIAEMAAPLMAFPLDDRLEIAGVYQA